MFCAQFPGKFYGFLSELRYTVLLFGTGVFFYKTVSVYNWIVRMDYTTDNLNKC